jgi:RNA polymerase sigma-70 factor (ECF subfamily)
MLTTSIGLLRRLRLTDSREAWCQFVDLYGPLIYRWNQAAGLQPADALDVSQDVMIHVLERVETFERRRQGSFRSWLRAVSCNMFRSCVNRSRSERKFLAADVDVATLPEVSGVGWAAHYERDILRRGLELVRSEVEPRTWEVFAKVFIERRDAGAVALEMGMRRNAVHVIQSRMLARLNRVVSRFLEDVPVPPT